MLMFVPIAWYPANTMTATAAIISAYSAIVWPRANSSAFTYSFLTRFISCSSVRASATPSAVHPVGARLEVLIHGAQQAADVRTHQLVAGIDNYRDGRENQRIFSHRLAAREPISLHIQFPDQIHFLSLLLGLPAECNSFVISSGRRPF